MTQRPVDESPLSEFVTKMRDVFARRLAAETVGDKHALEREMKGLMRQYLGRDAWDAAADAEAQHESVAVSRDTSSDQNCPTSSASSSLVQHEPVDRKRLAAGEGE